MNYVGDVCLLYSLYYSFLFKFKPLTILLIIDCKVNGLIDICQ